MVGFRGVGFRHRILPGGHFFLSPNLPAVLAGLRPWSLPARDGTRLGTGRFSGDPYGRL